MNQILAFVLFTPPLLFLRAHVLVDMWEWFILPLGAPVVGLAHALGLSLLLEWCTSSSKDDGRECLEIQVAGFLLMLCIWGLGALFAWMM